MIISEAVEFLGCSPQSEKLDLYLISLGFDRRPEYADSPIDFLENHEDGYLLDFSHIYGFKDSYGRPNDECGDMILEAIKCFGPKNRESFKPYQHPLPLGIAFTDGLEQLKALMGEPTVINHIGNIYNYVWWGIEGKTISANLTADLKEIVSLSFLLATIDPPIQMNW